VQQGIVLLCWVALFVGKEQDLAQRPHIGGVAEWIRIFVVVVHIPNIWIMKPDLRRSVIFRVRHLSEVLGIFRAESKSHAKITNFQY